MPYKELFAIELRGLIARPGRLGVKYRPTSPQIAAPPLLPVGYSLYGCCHKLGALEKGSFKGSIYGRFRADHDQNYTGCFLKLGGPFCGCPCSKSVLFAVHMRAPSFLKTPVSWMRGPYLRLDVGLYIGLMLWPVLNSLYRIHVLWAYQKYCPLLSSQVSGPSVLEVANFSIFAVVAGPPATSILR